MPNDHGYFYGILFLLYTILKLRSRVHPIEGERPEMGRTGKIAAAVSCTYKNRESENVLLGLFYH